MKKGPGKGAPIFVSSATPTLNSQVRIQTGPEGAVKGQGGRYTE
jgi:hypothetical protein